MPSKCHVDGCDRWAQGKGGKCIKHGANIKRCSSEGCSNKVQNGGVCKKHGAKVNYKLCSIEECTNQVQKGGVCRKHGAKGNMCSEEGCRPTQAQRGGLCIKHGGDVKRCSSEGCTNQARRGGVCIRHGAKLKRCSVEGCANQAQKAGVCKRHGAKVKRKLCNYEGGCTNQAQKGGVCVKHGAKKGRNYIIPTMASITIVVLLLLSLSSKTLSLSFAPGIVNRAIYILEEASSQNTPIDAALRRYAKHHERSYVNSEEYKSISDILRNIAVSQYRIDWQLRADGIDCTPKNRVAFLQKGTPLECKDMDLQTKLECPTWAWTGLKEAFPNEEDLVKELRALMEPAPLDLRVNTLKCEDRISALRDVVDAGYDATSTPWSPIGIRLQERTALGKIPGLLDGIVEPQDEGSQLVASLLQAQPGEVVADYCAGSGGKTLQLAAAMKNKGRLYSMDVSEDRLERGKARFKKAGVSNVQRQVVQEDMSRKDKWLKRRKGTFDRVLVDAPCSGVGSWRRKPDARRTWDTFDEGFNDGIDRLANLLPLQQQILQRASRLVKVGGRLVYVTCSLLPQENEKQIMQFLESDVGSGWRVESPPGDFSIPFEVDNGRFLRLTPAQHSTDGFFAAILTKSKS